MRCQTILLALCAMLGAAAPAAGQTREPRIEARILAEINRARTDPAGYARELRDYRALFDGPVVRMPGSEVGLRTREGVVAVDEAIAFLTAQAPLPPLAEVRLLARAADRLVADQGPGGLEGHADQYGRNVRERARREGGGSRAATAEVIAYGRADAVSAVRQLIVDDGIADRGHRTILFDARYRSAGVACGDHARHRHMCVVDFSSSPNGQ